MLTEDQLNKIASRPLDDLVQILDICIEQLGIVDVKTASEVLCLNRSRIYQVMNDQNSREVGSHKVFLINKYLN